MELDALKKSWENLDRRVQQTVMFNERLVENIVSSRVTTTVDGINRLYNAFYVVLTIEVIFLVGILFGNPFDFRYTLQYVPYGLLLPGVIMAFINLLQISKSIRQISTGQRIDLYVKGIVSIYDRNIKFERWFGIIFLFIGLTIPFSFLPNKLERMGLSGAIGDTAIMIGVTLTMYTIAFRFGAFKNRHKEKLERDLKEWNKLKELVGKMEE